jgi:hypothetical protein
MIDCGEEKSALAERVGFDIGEWSQQTEFLSITL